MILWENYKIDQEYEIPNQIIADQFIESDLWDNEYYRPLNIQIALYIVQILKSSYDPHKQQKDIEDIRSIVKKKLNI